MKSTKLRVIRKVCGVCVVGLYCFSMVAVKSLNNFDILFAGLWNLMRLWRRQVKKTSERLMVEVQLDIMESGNKVTEL